MDIVSNSLVSRLSSNSHPWIIVLPSIKIFYYYFSFYVRIAHLDPQQAHQLFLTVCCSPFGSSGATADEHPPIGYKHKENIFYK